VVFLCLYCWKSLIETETCEKLNIVMLPCPSVLNKTTCHEGLGRGGIALCIISLCTS